jgi:hypothetical protein
MTEPAVTSHHLREEGEEELAIAIVPKNGLACVSSGGEMVDGTGVL